MSEQSLAALLAPARVPTSWRSLLHQTVRHCRNLAPLLLVDLFIGAACLLFANVTLAVVGIGQGFSPAGRLVYLLPAFIASLAVMGLYPGIGMSPVVELRKLSLASMSVVTALLAVALASGQSLGPTIVFSAALGVTLLLLMPTARGFTRAWLATQSWWGEPVLIFGEGPLGLRIYENLTREASRGMRPLGVIDELHSHWTYEAEGECVADGYLGPPEEAKRIAAERGVQWAVVACPEAAVAADSRETKSLDREGAGRPAVGGVVDNPHTLACLRQIPNRLVIDADGVPSLWTQSRECAGAAALHVGERLLMPWPQATKRFVDVSLALAVGVATLPLFAVLAVAVKLTSRGPVFYGHARIGRDGERFRVWKFRTMVQDADAWLQECLDADPELREEWERDQKLRDDPRVTSAGGLLRKTSLDELPQLWNVLRGDMSLVGPRPIVDKEVAKYRHIYPMYTRVRPGITGLWQISGRNQTTYEERVALDNYYVRNWSPWLDTHILARTVRTVLLREGAF